MNILPAQSSSWAQAKRGVVDGFDFFFALFQPFPELPHRSGPFQVLPRLHSPHSRPDARRLQRERLQMPRKAVVNPSGCRRFRIVDQGGDAECRVDPRQKMRMIPFSAEFRQAAPPHPARILPKAPRQSSCRSGVSVLRRSSVTKTTCNLIE